MSDSKKDPKAQKKVQTSVPLSSITQGTTIRSQIEEELERAFAEVESWANEKLPEIVGLGKILRKEKITPKVLLRLTDENLKSLGFIALGDRVQILDEIAKLKPEPTSTMIGEQGSNVNAGQPPTKKLRSTTDILKETLLSELGQLSEAFGIQNEWLYSPDGEKYVEELLSKLMSQNEGVWKIAMKTWLQSNEKDIPTIYLRECQRELWNAVFNWVVTNNKRHAVIIGNPSIGKSRSMAYLLALLLSARKIVIYHARKEPAAYAFVPLEISSSSSAGNTPQYKVFRSSKFKSSDCLILSRSDVYLIIDAGPPEIPENIPTVGCHVIFCSSPRDDQYHYFIGQHEPPMWIMPVWEKEELKQLQTDHNLTDEQFENRYRLFGGRIGYVFTENLVLRFNSLVTAVETLQTIDGLATALNSGRVDLDEKVVPSMAFIFNVLKDDTGKYLFMKDTRNYFISIGSAVAYYLLARRYWTLIMRKLDPTSLLRARDNISYANLFELIASIFIELGGEYLLWSKKKLNLIAANRIPFKGTWNECVNRCGQLPGRDDKPRTLIVPIHSNQPVFDFADAKNRYYQVTIGKTHGIIRNCLQNILKVSMGIDILDANFSVNQTLDFYFIVPERQDFSYSFEGEFDMDPRVKELEKMTVAGLKSECQKEGLKPGGNKEILLQMLMRKRNMTSLTTEKIEKRIKEVVHFDVIFLPLDPPPRISELIEKIQDHC